MRSGIAVAIGLAALMSVPALLLYLGMFPVAADEPHWGLTERILQTVRDRSVLRQSRDIVVPALDDPRLQARGGGQYVEMCAGCHGAPGVPGNELQRGLYPPPPSLADHAMEPRQTFWVIKHGFKMTGMPAWGRSHDDGEIWAIVAFIGKLPGMTPEQYQTIVGTGGTGSDAGMSMPMQQSGSTAGRPGAHR